MIDTQLSKRQYEIIRAATKKKIGFNIFPSYKIILETKCYSENITESSASNNLQKLLDHTVTRVIEAIYKENIHINCNELIAYKRGL